MKIIVKVSSILYALAMIVFGVQHFIYASFAANIVPGWIPWHLFWVYFVGIALILSGISIALNKLAQLACVMLGCMLFLFVILIHIPLILHNYRDGGEITNAFKDVGLACAAFILGKSFQNER